VAAAIYIQGVLPNPLGTAPVTITIGGTPSAIVAGDFDGDLILDLAVADSSSGAVFLLQGVGNGTFVPRGAVPTGAGTAPPHLATGDFNRDGKLDLVTANNGGESFTFLKNIGGFTFSPSTTPPVGFRPTWVAAADLNMDGILDIVSANSTSGTVSVLLGDGSGG